MAKTLYTLTGAEKLHRSATYKYRINTGAEITPLNQSAVRTLSQNTKQGFRDTDWKVKVAKQTDASSTYINTRWEYVRPAYNVALGTHSLWDTIKKKYDVVSYRTAYFDLAYSASYAGVTVTDSTLGDQALARFKRKLSGKVGDAQLLVPSAELTELRSLIRQAADFNTKFLEAYTELRDKKGLRALELMQNSWLAYSFAFAPMMADIISAAEAVKSYLQQSGLHRVRGSASKKWVTGAKVYQQLYHGVAWETHINVTHTLQYTFTAGIDLSYLSGNDYSLAEHFGVSEFAAMTPSITWELLPHTWIVDIFTTCGEFMEDAFVSPPGTTKYLTQSRKYTAEGTETVTTVKTNLATAYVNFTKRGEITIPGTFRFINFERTVPPALPHRSLRFKTVDEIGRNAVKKLLNLASLLRVPRKLNQKLLGRKYTRQDFIKGL